MMPKAPPDKPIVQVRRLDDLEKLSNEYELLRKEVRVVRKGPYYGARGRIIAAYTAATEYQKGSVGRGVFYTVDTGSSLLSGFFLGRPYRSLAMKKGALQQLRMKARLAIAARAAEKSGVTKVKIQIDNGGQFGYVRGVKPGNKNFSRLSIETV